VAGGCKYQRRLRAASVIDDYDLVARGFERLRAQRRELPLQPLRPVARRDDDGDVCHQLVTVPSLLRAVNRHGPPWTAPMQYFGSGSSLSHSWTPSGTSGMSLAPTPSPAGTTKPWYERRSWKWRSAASAA